MSEINGSGYGDKHDWKCVATPQGLPFIERHTFWECKKCGYRFSHFYNYTKDIFLAMKEFEVPEECDENKPEA